MEPKNPQDRKFVLSNYERAQEIILLSLCVVICLGFFVKIVFF